MRVAVLAFGSRGDVQPYVARGKGFQDAGHAVRLVTHENFAELVKAHGLEFWPVRGDVQAFVDNPAMRELVEKGNFVAITRQTARAAREAAVQWAEDSLDACRGVDLLVTGIGGLFSAIAFAEKFDIPLL